MKYRLKRFIFVVQNFLGASPYLFVFLYRLFGKSGHLLIKKETQIVIEGFPRSGNTFSVVALEWAQQRELKIAHHLHAAAQIILAVKYNIPAVALIRSPEETITSLVIREPHITLSSGLREYIRFYQAILPFKDDLFVVNFEQLISDYGLSIKRINEKFNTDFIPFEHNEENVKEVFDLVQKYAIEESTNNVLDEKKVARPSADRKAQAEILSDEIHQKKYSNLLLQANSLYKELIA